MPLVHIRFYRLSEAQQEEVFLRDGVEPARRFGRKALSAYGAVTTTWVRCGNVIYWVM